MGSGQVLPWVVLGKVLGWKCTQPCPTLGPWQGTEGGHLARTEVGLEGRSAPQSSDSPCGPQAPTTS